jgi:hypothetical protein
MSDDLLFYYWGPLLMKTTVSNSFLETLKQPKLDIPANHDLVGKIKKEFYYDKNFVEKNTEEIYIKIKDYLHLLSTHWRRKDPGDIKPFQIELTNLWLNCQKAGEFNPIHNHSEDISFVINVDIPEEIYEEETSTNGLPSGCIQFVNSLNYAPYKESSIKSLLRPIAAVQEKPKTGDMFIFPADLYHHVQSFDSNVVRKTVSGNIRLIEL